MMKPAEQSKKLRWLVAAWLGLATMALYVMADYGASSGRAADAPERWPVSPALNATIERQSGKPSLVLLAHPLCPCTRASLWELESLTNRFNGLFDTHVLFFEPTGGAPAEWSTSDLWAIAKRLPGTQAHVDRDGLLARHFGAYTSGQVLLYDSQGRLQFAGGITPSRGHTGDNPGRAAVVRALLQDQAIDPLAVALSPVFGCSLHEPEYATR